MLGRELGLSLRIWVSDCRSGLEQAAFVAVTTLQSLAAAQHSARWQHTLLSPAPGGLLHVLLGSAPC